MTKIKNSHSAKSGEIWGMIKN